MLVLPPQGEQGEDGKAEGPPGPPGDRVRAPTFHPLDRCQGGAPSPSCVGSRGEAAASSAEGVAQEAQVWHPLQSSIAVLFI